MQISEAIGASVRRKRCVLHPEKNPFLLRWDVVTSIALVYTATLTPFETAFVPPVEGVEAWGEPWFLANRGACTRPPRESGPWDPAPPLPPPLARLACLSSLIQRSRRVHTPPPPRSAVLDVIFFADLVVQFFVAYQTGSRYGGRSWVLERRLV